MFEVIVDSVKGKCVFATKSITSGTVILKEKPSLVAEDAYDALYKIYGETEFENVDTLELRKSYESLVPYEIDKYIPPYSELNRDMESLPEYMRDFFSTWKPQKLRLLVSKFMRNAFTYKSPPCAILLRATRFNHSCCNNVDFHIDTYGAFVFTTNRNILPGDELYIKYIETNTSTKKRHHVLVNQYGFCCTCALCALKNIKNKLP